MAGGEKLEMENELPNSRLEGAEKWRPNLAFHPMPDWDSGTTQPHGFGLAMSVQLPYHLHQLYRC